MRYAPFGDDERAIILDEIARGRGGWTQRAAARLPGRTEASIQAYASAHGWTPRIGSAYPRQHDPRMVGKSTGVTKRAAHSGATDDEPERSPSLRRPPGTDNRPDFLKDLEIWDER